MEFRILGPLEVLEQGQRLSLPGARERAAGFLLLHGGEVVSADRLIDELWGEQPPETARKSLQVRVAGIRKALGPEVVLMSGGGYTVTIPPEAVDLHRFERLVEEASAADPAQASRSLREALALWRGAPLAEFAYEPFAQRAIARLEELRLMALEKRIDADLLLGRHADLVGELQALVAEHPLRERFRGHLMLALYRSGRQAEALEEYQVTRRTLLDSLGIEPSRGVQELHRAILRQDPQLEPPPTVIPERAILVVSRADESAELLNRLAEALARRPPKELILARLLAGDGDLRAETAQLQARQAELDGRGISTRVAAFVSPAPAADIVRLATEQDVDLILVDGSADLFVDGVLVDILAKAPCDVAVLVGTRQRIGSLLVPFVGAEHDWAAVELAAWLAGALDIGMLLAGPREGPSGRDASRLLADASLAIQRALGVTAEPLLLDSGPQALLAAAADAGLVIVGLADSWRVKGLGASRRTLVSEAQTPVILVRRGLRPGGLAPARDRTRFTWSVRV